jgi:hypothetical protein
MSMTLAPPSEDQSTEAPDHTRLAQIDAAFVPRLQRLARPLRRAAGAPVELLTTLDDRVAGGRPARSAIRNRSLVAFVTVLVLFGAGLVQFERYPELRALESRVDPSPVPDVTEPMDPDGGTMFGPIIGARVDPYLDARQGELADADGDEVRFAVISFDDFVAPERAQELVGGLTLLRVQYQLPEREPRPEETLLTGDLADELGLFLADLVATLREEEQETASMIDTTEDPDFRADFEARVDELRGLRNTLMQDPRIVFALVVRGTVTDLRPLGQEPGVRLVDLVPRDADIDALRLHGILPTDRDRFTHGRTG